MASRVNWLQAFAEVGILIVGAFLALGADSWADARREAAEEGAYLQSLRDDFATTDSIFRLRLIGQDDQIAHTTALIQLLGGPERSVPLDSLNRLVREAFLWQPFVPVLATYEDMVNSGDLRLIRNPELRATMAEFVSYMEGIGPYNDTGLAQWNEQITPYMIRHFDVTDLYGPDADVWDGVEVLPGYEWGPQSARLESSESAYWSREFVNLVAVRTIGLMDTAGFVRGAVDRVQIIVGMIDEELAQTN